MYTYVVLQKKSFQTMFNSPTFRLSNERIPQALLIEFFFHFDRY